MMRASLLTAAVLAIHLTSSPAHACSKFALPIPLGDSGAFFVGEASADTLHAGPGAVAYHSGHGHYGPTDRDAIYGQVVRVDRTGGPATRLLPPGTHEAVVVPWDYDSLCRPLPWGRSARWVSPGTPGFFIAELRAPEDWVGGRPTFDLHNPGSLPYTGSETFRGIGRHDVSSLLSPDQVFDLYRAAPTASEVADRKAESLGALRRWVQDHADLAQRPPAEMLVSFVVNSVAHAELKEVDHPVVGTWRFTVRTPGDSSYTLYARTEAHPNGRWTPSRTPVVSVPGVLPLVTAEGYNFRSAISNDIDGLPEFRSRDHPQAYIHALAHPEDSSAERMEWRGWLDPSLLVAIQGDRTIERAVEEASEHFGHRLREGLPFETPARFTRGEDGVLRVRQPFPLSDGGLVVVEGEQVSRVTVHSRW